MREILLISELTFREAVRRRIIAAGLILTALFLALYYTGAHFAFESLRAADGRGGVPSGLGGGDFIEFQALLFLSMGLFVANMVGALFAVFAAIGAISGEVDQGTLQTILTRPIGRAQVVLGKWLGHAAMITLYMGAFLSSIVLIVYTQSGWFPPNVGAALAVLISESLFVLTAALLGSSFLPTIANAVIVLMLFMVGMIGGIMEQIAVAIDKESLFTTGIVSSFIMPTDALYRYALHLLRPPVKGTLLEMAQNMGPFGSASPPSVWMLLYAFLLGCALLFTATRIFSRRDL